MVPLIQTVDCPTLPSSYISLNVDKVMYNLEQSR